MTVLPRALAPLGALCASLSLFSASALASDCDQPVAICMADPGDGFPLITDGLPVPLVVSEGDAAPVRRAATDIVTDLGRVGDQQTELLAAPGDHTQLIIAGTLGQSPLVDGLVESGKLDVSGVDGVWEAYAQQVIDDPMPGVERALVIAGADPRGTVYGLYDLVERAGVSPWEWWADVPVRQQANLFVAPGRVTDAPAIKYRGIFLNDENPALYGWVHETYGGFNADFYERVFQLILRQKGNYLWPAMWGKAFYDDDPDNPKSAERYGVVMGTSHHEPLMRAHVEWERYGDGPWDYTRNDEALQSFWRDSMERMGNEETIVTIGMRGDGDEAMTEGTAIELLENIVRDQRKIIEDMTGKPASEQPQIWALYKEVQDYYDQGMDVPDDVTLLFADDNWGNIRRLPDPEAERPGGYGVYYHFDYVGGPRNYKWINVTQNERVWEQMHSAWEYGATRMWIVNVGDLKPMELPISFFLDYAWDPEDWPLERLPDYSTEWAAEQFGEGHATEIAELLDLYTKYNSRRNPELIDAETYSLVHHGEFKRIVDEYNVLAQRADEVREQLPEEYDDAFVQLVWFPIKASANLNELYYTVALNRLYAEQGRFGTNELAERARELYARDAELTRLYHEDVADGKWNHMMAQTHIGYTYWQQPDEQAMPEVREIDLPRRGELRIAVEGDERVWPGADGMARLPAMDSVHQQTREIDLFNTGRSQVDFKAAADQSWVELSEISGKFREQETLSVSVDWDAVPAGTHTATIALTRRNGDEVAEIAVPVINADGMELAGAVPDAGVVSIDAAAAQCKITAGDQRWITISNLGRTGDAITPMPVITEPQVPGEGPNLAYQFSVYEPGTYEVEVFLSPSLDVTGGDGLDFAVSVNGAEPQRINLAMAPDEPAWNQSVADRAHRRMVNVEIEEAGPQTLRLWMIDPGVVFQKVVIAKDEAPDSYLGAPVTKQLPSTLSCAGE